MERPKLIFKLSEDGDERYVLWDEAYDTKDGIKEYVDWLESFVEYLEEELALAKGNKLCQCPHNPANFTRFRRKG